MNVAQLLEDQVLAHPDTAAIVEGQRGRRITFAELAAAGEGAAASLAASGLSAGDTVLVFHPMSIELYAGLVAIFRLGLVAAFIDPSNGRAFIERCCDRLRPAALFASPRAHALRLLSPALRRIRRHFSFAALPATTRFGSRSARVALAQRADGDAALVTFTSGSTGAPKAAVRTHGMLAAQLHALTETLSLAEPGVAVAAMPIVLLANLAAGVTSLIPGVDLRSPGAVDAARLLDDIERHEARSIVASPALLDRLADRVLAAGRPLKRMRRISTGGAPVFPVLLDRLATAAPRAAITAIYGSTEAEPIAHVERADISEADKAAMSAGAGLLAGRPVDSIELRIVRNRWGTPIAPASRAQFESACAPAGVPGEIAVSGAHVVTGYLGGIGDEETKFRVDGAVWHRTGDLGYLDATGRLWLLGRCAAAIADARGALYPFAVECAASDIRGVARSAVLAMHSERVLLVEPAGRGPDLEALRSRLAWAGLERIAVVPRIPVDRRHNAKVDYEALARMATKSRGPKNIS